MTNEKPRFFYCWKAGTRHWRFLEYVARLELSSGEYEIYDDLYNRFITDDPEKGDFKLISPPMFESVDYKYRYSKKHFKKLQEKGFISVEERNGDIYINLMRPELKLIARAYMFDAFMGRDFDGELWEKIFEACWNSQKWSERNQFAELRKEMSKNMGVKPETAKESSFYNNIILVTAESYLQEDGSSGIGSKIQIKLKDETSSNWNINIITKTGKKVQYKFPRQVEITLDGDNCDTDIFIDNLKTAMDELEQQYEKNRIIYIRKWLASKD